MFCRACYLLFYILFSVLVGCSSKQSAKQADAQAVDVDITALENQAAGLMGQFNYDKAVAVCKQLGELPGLSKSQQQKFKVDLAIALLNRRQEGDQEVSAKLLDAAIKADSQNLRAKYCRALLYYHEGKTSEAKSLFEDVARADLTDGYAIYFVGQCCFLTGEYDLALKKFAEAQEIDPYLRSAYYGAFQAAQRLKKNDLSREYLDQFQKLATNPRARLAELKYTRMGPQAEVFVTSTQGAPQIMPDGDLFVKPEALSLSNRQAVNWQNCKDPVVAPNITVADINGDKRSDLFIANAFADSDSDLRNAVLISEPKGFRLQIDHPLASVKDVNTVLWGDYDNDGNLDAYFCCREFNQLWRSEATAGWSNVTEETQTAFGDWNTVDGACFDADHDGDLDYLLANINGKSHLLSNNRNGAFSSIGEELGVSLGEAHTKQVLIADIDSDDDADMVFINEASAHEVMVNDRFWNYKPSLDFEQFNNSKFFAAAACDTNVDGQIEIFTLDAKGVTQWQPTNGGKWAGTRVVSQDFEAGNGSVRSIDLVDFDGDTEREIIVMSNRVWRIFSLGGTEKANSGDSKAGPTGMAIWQQEGGPAILGFIPEEIPQVWQPGPGRHKFVLMTLSGKTDKAAEMRSNASGIGVLGAARIQDRWATLSPFRSGSGPGQSLQPTTIGLAGRESVDFVRLLWPDGVSQTELKLKPGSRIDLAETQRQAGSCPLVFVWDGSRYVFVADVLGAGGIGFNLGRAQYYEPRSSENFHLPLGLLKPQEGKYVVKLGEPMEEICYFDAVRLVSYDLPPGWQMTLDERFGASEPMPTGMPYFYRDQILPTQATNDLGNDITAEILSVDKVAAPLDRRDHRFIGLADPRTITLTFEQPLDSLTSPVLVFDGWVEYAYSQTAFAAWQAGAEYLEPTIEARGEAGDWQVIAPRFGYMAGTSRQSTMPLDLKKLPLGTRELRISTNMQIYWDRLMVVDASGKPAFERRELELETALVDDVGFSTRKLLDQRYTEYDYDDRPPLADARHPAGFYTQIGDARELVQTTDNALAIIGPGEELHLEFTPPANSPPAGWTRHFVLESDGWCKDADLFTKDAGTVEPLPSRVDSVDPADSAEEESKRYRKTIHAKYNTRYKSGY